MLPLIGSIADRRGRLPVLVAGLVVFALGSLLTGVAYGLGPMVLGRFLQGVGGGALVPATLALVADLFPTERRGVPLGLVSAVQEAGSLLGPLGGAVVLAVADWRAIFAINLLVGAILAIALQRAGEVRAPASLATPLVSRPLASARRTSIAGALLLLTAAVTGALVFTEPTTMMRDLTWGRLFIPVFGSGRWTTPLGLTCLGALVLYVVCCALTRRTSWPLIDLRSWSASAREVDLPGALLLSLALAGVILAFATADPQVEAMATRGWAWLAIAAVALSGFVLRQRLAGHPLIPHGALRPRAAWGSIVVSLLIGVALVAVLIDVPLFARTTIYPDSQLLAALVLVRFLVALPIGAILGGWLIRHLSAGVIGCAGLLLGAAGLAWMAQWDIDALRHASATLPLVLAGLGFGLVLAPVNAAILASTDPAIHGLASSLTVVARMVGMLVGISTLTTLGLRHYYAAQADLPVLSEVCGAEKGLCDAYRDLLQQAGIAQEHTVFGWAACAAAAGAVLALVLLRGAATARMDTRETLAGLGG